MSRTLYARLVAYRAFGERLGVLPEPVSFDASIIHNDSGALSVEYSALSAGAGLLDGQLTDGLEIALEVSDGTGYVEPDNARFVVTGRSGKTDDRTGTVKYTGQCIQWLLSKAKMLDTQHLLTDGDNKGKRPFYSANPGTIVKTLMDENAARGGVAAGLTLGFDTAKDAGGDGWAKQYTLYYSLGVDLQSALSSLVQGGGCDWRTRERRLDIYNTDSGKLSRDLSKSVILQLGRDISEAPYEESISSLASTILVEGDNSLVFTMDNPAAPHPWGKWEDYVSQGGVSDEATATAFMQTKLSDAARVRGQYTRSVITTGDITSLPLVDYHAGDWITAPTVSHAEKTRVQEIDVSMRQGDGLTVSLALNDIKYDASVRQSKRMQGITGGASLAGSQGGKAASEHDHRVAAAPAGLTATTTAYIDSTGHARGLATVQWAAVATATDGTALEISGYTVEWRKHVDGAPWHAAGTTDKTTLGISPLDCGTQVEIRVRANATYSDQPGAWADPVVVTVENDVTPCSVPSKPVLSSALGVVTIHWDGKTDAGASMESDFDHVEVGRGTTANDLTPIAATQSGQGDYVDTTRDPGTTWAYALRSVDHSGNASDWSQTTSVEVASILSDQEIKDNITDPLNKAQEDIAKAEASMNDLTKTVSTVDGKVTTSGKTPTTGDASGKPDGAMWYVVDANGNITATYIIKSGSWVKYAWASSSIADEVNQAISNAASAASTAQSTADAANSAAKDAQSAATAAQATADGKNKVVRSTSAPSSTSGYSDGDQWWVYSGDTVTALYLFSGTAWVSQTLTNSVIANIDAGKITSGYVNADRINAGSITGSKIAAGTITASNMAAGTLTAASGIIADAAIGSAQIIDGSIGTAEIADAAISTAKIADASITNAKIANLDAGKITSGYVDAARIAANSITADKLLVGRGGDYSPNPTFDPSGPLPAAPHSWIPGNGGHSVQLTSRDNIFPESTAFPVTKGDTFYITCEATHQSGTAPLNLGLWWTVNPGTATSIQPWTNMTLATDLGQSANDQNWHTYAATISVPTASDAVVTAARGYIGMEAGLPGEETVAQNTWRIGNYHIYKVSDETLIADGAISTNKLAANVVTADKLAANAVTADKIAAGTITSDKIAAGQFTGYVFTGSVFQSSEAANTGIKINSTALQMWDGAHNRTVYLDGEGKNNVLTGSFQTSATGNRIEIDSQATATIFGSTTSLSGQSIRFRDDDFAASPEIDGFFTNSDLGDAPRIALLSGWKTDHDPAAMLYLQSWPRTKGATGSGITSAARMVADTDYTEPDSTKKSYASLDLQGIGGSGAYVSLEAHAYGGSEAHTWVTATRNDGVTQVGIGADAFTQSIYLGGKLGGITNQQTFQTNNWKAYWGTTPAVCTLNPVTVALQPAKYGVYHAVANADCEWGSIFIHVRHTGTASQYEVMGFNAGTGAFNGDVWVDAIAWLC